jgi:hypothetical protein
MYMTLAYPLWMTWRGSHLPSQFSPSVVSGVIGR